MKYISQLTLITAAVLLAGNLHCADHSAAQPHPLQGLMNVAIRPLICEYILVPKEHADAATGLRFVYRDQVYKNPAEVLERIIHHDDLTAFRQLYGKRQLEDTAYPNSSMFPTALHEIAAWNSVLILREVIATQPEDVLRRMLEYRGPEGRWPTVLQKAITDDHSDITCQLVNAGACVDLPPDYQLNGYEKGEGSIVAQLMKSPCFYPERFKTAGYLIA
ncbi:MAG TPA: hypothetical protein VJJ83_02130, partial [Candidatus Babeliales bacterium]|nr:hypothetical protein [Candidatus Babeliales bacterium]